jgi:hypothetical protein
MIPTFSAAEPGIPHTASSAYHSVVSEEWVRRSVTVRGSAVFPHFAESVQQQLRDVVACANHDNWDGMKSLAANRRAVRQANRFLSMLPPSAFRSIVPEVTVDPDGEIAIEWYVSPSQLFSVSIGANGRLAWAGIIDGEEVPGHAMMKQRIPQELLDYINQLVADTSHP